MLQRLSSPPQHHRACRQASLTRQPSSATKPRTIEFRPRAAVETNVEIRQDQDVLVTLAKLFINTPGLFSLASTAGRFFIRNAAETRGIRWGEHVEDLKAKLPLIETIKEQVENKQLPYPSYYLAPIHGYADSNLCWDAAMEQEPARKIVAARNFPSLHATEAEAKLADNTTCIIWAYWSKYKVPGKLSNIIDLGCCTGNQTYELAQAFPSARVVGLDLSPYFLAIAQLRQQQREAAGITKTPPIQYMHGLAEQTGLPDASFDFVNISYVFHECPQTASQAILKEANRLLRPGGVVFVVDSNPEAAALQKLHPAIFLLREQSEPWMQEFRQLDITGELHGSGFENVVVRDVSARDRGFIAMKVRDA